MKKFLPTLDTNADWKYAEIVDTSCSFLKKPYLLGTSSYSAISVAAKLELNGTLYAVAVSAAQDLGAASSDQIVAGLDSSNRRSLQIVQPMVADQLTNFTFSSLKSSSDYNLYIVCSNSLPVFPEVSDEVFTINWKTDSSPAKEAVITDAGVWAGLSWLLALVLISL
jgi:hypothetical protein